MAIESNSDPNSEPGYDAHSGPTATDIIRHGEIVSHELTPMGSNYTFVVKIEMDAE